MDAFNDWPSLPFIDRHCIHIEASSERTWEALGEVLSKGFGGLGSATLAQILGSDARSVEGPALAEGSTFVGFRVVQAEALRRVILAGKHRFSSYSLGLEINGSTLCATTHAEFPGPQGTLYRALLLGSRAHVVAIRKILKRVKRQAERPPAG